MDVTKKRSPKAVVFVQEEGPVSFYEVWIYPYAKMQTGARVLFFRANQERTLICYIYLEQDFVPDASSPTLGDVQYRRFIDNLCAIATRTLAKQQVALTEDYDVHISAGTLTYADFS
jgi:hypothetical protein